MAAEGAWLRPSAEEAQRPPWPGAKGPRGLGSEGEITEAQLQAKAAEVARITPTWQGPVVENHREIAAEASGLRGQAPSVV